MKSKQKTYLLLLIVLIIWSVVVYQFLAFSGGQDFQYTKNDNQKNEGPKLVGRKDSFNIDVNYRDPFLNKMHNELPQPRLKRLKATSKKDKLEINQPVVLYKGMISDVKDRVKLFMINIDGNTYMMKKGDKEKGVLLKSGSRNYIVVKYGGIQKEISIE